MNRGRRSQPRGSELGRFIKAQREEQEPKLSMKDLAFKAEVSYQKLCRLEFSNALPRHPQEFLINIAHALGVHPDRLLVKANLTPLLSPRSDAQAPLTTRNIKLTLFVDEDERRQLENYLQFLRNVRLAESLSQEAENNAEV